MPQRDYNKHETHGVHREADQQLRIQQPRRQVGGDGRRASLEEELPYSGYQRLGQPPRQGCQRSS